MYLYAVVGFRVCTHILLMAPLKGEDGILRFRFFTVLGTLQGLIERWAACMIIRIGIGFSSVYLSVCRVPVGLEPCRLYMDSVQVHIHVHVDRVQDDSRILEMFESVLATARFRASIHSTH